MGRPHGLGAGLQLQFAQGSKGIATDNAGNVYVTDSGHSVRKITPAGVVSTLAGNADSWGRHLEGQGAAATFSGLKSIAVDGTGNVYVVQDDHPYDGEYIRKITPSGLASTIMKLPIPAEAIAAHGSSLYIVMGSGVAVLSNVSHDDMKENPKDKTTARQGGATASSPELSLLAGNFFYRDVRQEYVDGRGTAALFDGLDSIATDAAGNVYVTGRHDDSPIRKITPSGQTSTLPLNAIPGERLVEREHVDGARYGGLHGITFDRKGNMFVVNERFVRKITPGGEESIHAGNDSRRYGSAYYDRVRKDGIGTAARFDGPQGLSIDREDNLYVADHGTPSIRKITPAGAVSTVADGTVRFKEPEILGTDIQGNVYMRGRSRDYTNELYKVAADGQVYVMAGDAFSLLKERGSLVADMAGNIFATDVKAHTIRKITPAGELSTFAGTPNQRGKPGDVELAMGKLSPRLRELYPCFSDWQQAPFPGC